MYDAVGTFNEGSAFKCSVLQELCITPGFYSAKLFKEIDIERIRNAKRQWLAATREGRIAKRNKKRRREEMEADDSYVPGGAPL